MDKLPSLLGQLLNLKGLIGKLIYWALLSMTLLALLPAEIASNFQFECQNLITLTLSLLLLTIGMRVLTSHFADAKSNNGPNNSFSPKSPANNLNGFAKSCLKVGQVFTILLLLSTVGAGGSFVYKLNTDPPGKCRLCTDCPTEVVQIDTTEQELVKRLRHNSNKPLGIKPYHKPFLKKAPTTTDTNTTTIILAGLDESQNSVTDSAVQNFTPPKIELLPRIETKHFWVYAQSETNFLDIFLQKEYHYDPGPQKHGKRKKRSFFGRIFKSIGNGLKWIWKGVSGIFAAKAPVDIDQLNLLIEKKELINFQLQTLKHIRQAKGIYLPKLVDGRVLSIYELNETLNSYTGNFLAYVKYMSLLETFVQAYDNIIFEKLKADLGMEESDVDAAMEYLNSLIPLDTPGKIPPLANLTTAFETTTGLSLPTTSISSPEDNPLLAFAEPVDFTPAESDVEVARFADDQSTNNDRTSNDLNTENTASDTFGERRPGWNSQGQGATYPNHNRLNGGEQGVTYRDQNGQSNSPGNSDFENRSGIGNDQGITDNNNDLNEGNQGATYRGENLPDTEQSSDEEITEEEVNPENRPGALSGLNSQLKDLSGLERDLDNLTDNDSEDIEDQPEEDSDQPEKDSEKGLEEFTDAEISLKKEELKGLINNAPWYSTETDEFIDFDPNTMICTAFIKAFSFPRAIKYHYSIEVEEGITPYIRLIETRASMGRRRSPYVMKIRMLDYNEKLKIVIKEIKNKSVAKELPYYFVKD